MTTAPLSATLYQPNLEYRFTWLVWLCCAFSLAFVQAIPTLPAVTFLGAVLLYCAVFPHRAMQALTWNIIPWVLVVFGMISVIWSEQPSQSFRAAQQIAMTVLAAIMLAQRLPAKAFIAVAMYAYIASSVANLFMLHIFGSKNMVGQALALVMLTSFWVMLDKQQPKLPRIIAVLAFLGAASRLVDSDSAGAVFAGVIALLASVTPFLLRGLQFNTRMFMMGAGAFVVLMGVGIVSLALGNFSDVLLQSIGKDSTLTGRTLLWSHAASIIADHPFGLGLQAFWVEGNRDAIRFWESNYIIGHSGFHFHDLWLETGVELGLIGVLIAAWTTVVVFISILRWVLRDPRPESCFFFGFIIFFLSRTFGEVELFVQFFLPPMLFTAGYYYADRGERNSLS
jgi:exopolysaccharide production protein ExoQ